MGTTEFERSLICRSFQHKSLTILTFCSDTQFSFFLEALLFDCEELRCTALKSLEEVCLASSLGHVFFCSALDLNFAWKSFLILVWKITWRSWGYSKTLHLAPFYLIVLFWIYLSCLTFSKRKQEVSWHLKGFSKNIRWIHFVQ